MAASDILSPKEVELLAKLLRLLGADSPGERSAAAWKCHEFVKNRGIEWIDILDPGDAPPPILSVGVRGSHFDPKPTPAPRPAATRPSWQKPAAAPANPPQWSAAAFTAAQTTKSAPPPPPPPPPPSSLNPMGWCLSWQTAVAAMVQHHLMSLTKLAERTFITDLDSRAKAGIIRDLSPKQEVWLADICKRFKLTFPTQHVGPHAGVATF